LDAADAQDAEEPDRDAIAQALARLTGREERLAQAQQRLAQTTDAGASVSLTDADARRLRSGSGYTGGYNVQQAVTQEGNDHRSLWPMGQQAQAALGTPAKLTLLADTGDMNAEQARQCERAGMVPVVPMQKAEHTHAKGRYAKGDFHSLAHRDLYRCPAGELLQRYKRDRHQQTDYYRTSACRGCALKDACTRAAQRSIARPGMPAMRRLPMSEPKPSRS
jgi:transposase